MTEPPGRRRFKVLDTSIHLVEPGLPCADLDELPHRAPGRASELSEKLTATEEAGPQELGHGEGRVSASPPMTETPPLGVVHRNCLFCSLTPVRGEQLPFP